MEDRIYRLHYRGQLKEDITNEQLETAVNRCRGNVRRAQKQGRVLTAALYRSGRMLFLYYEAAGRPLAVTEPIAAGHNGGGEAQLLESGEDMQTTCLYPDEMLAPLNGLLQSWPGQRDDRLWVHMYHIYYHSLLRTAEDFRRSAVPEKRRGRIAFLREDKLFSYTYYHRAIVEEGLLQGDRYQSIALHENILFSYFEEPKQFVNIKNEPTEQSKVIDEWLAVDPESHFIHMPEGGGENFMFLPALFALGVEDPAEDWDD